VLLDALTSTSGKWTKPAAGRPSSLLLTEHRIACGGGSAAQTEFQFVINITSTLAHVGQERAKHTNLEAVRRFGSIDLDENRIWIIVCP
jgi:hypothetical protein